MKDGNGKLKIRILAAGLCLVLLLSACAESGGLTEEGSGAAATQTTAAQTAGVTETVPAAASEETESVPSAAERESVPSTAESEAVPSTAERESAASPAETKPGTSAEETEPTASAAETDPTASAAETDPAAMTEDTEPIASSEQPGSAGTEQEFFDEGADTACRVLSVKPCPEASASYFLREGDRIAVIAPSTLPSPAETDNVVRGLRNWGYIPVEGQYVRKSPRTLEECTADLMWALTDPAIRGIFCVRGGYGASEVMDRIAVDTVRAARKPILGYSDISVFHAAWTSVGLPSVHASMSRTFWDLPSECARITQQMMRGQTPVYRCDGSGYDLPGSAEGILIGGNLATLTAVLNTEYDCMALQEPYILFIEEVEEDLEHIHRFLTVLKHRGVLDRAAGIVFGEWIGIASESETADGSSRGGAYRSVADMIRRSFFPDADFPVAFGFPAGHGTANYPLLMGRTVLLQVDPDGFTLEWK